MEKLKVFALVMLGLLVVAASNYATYTFVSKEINSSMSEVREDVYGELAFTREYIMDVISSEREFNARQREALENETLQNFRQLQDYIDQETSQLHLNLESVQSQTQGEIEDLTQRIGTLQTGSDFSNVIKESVKSVVSIRTNLGQGSGVIFHPDGYVMTNKHVLEGVSQVTVIDYEGNFHQVQLVAMSNTADLAILKIVSDQEFDYLRWASPSSLEVGNRVVALGNPLGLSFTATEGIISAVDREIDYTGIGYIQTDVPINPGNSGGPLIDSNGRIVGINTVKLAGAEGLGFAIPASVARDMAEESIDE